MSSDAAETTNTATQSSSSSGRTQKKTTTSSASKSGGIVKAQKPDIIVLADNSRVVETNTLPNNRPVTVSDVDVVHNLSSAGVRPVMSDNFEIASTDHLPGHRPVAVSTLVVSDLDTLPGHRPIASNDIDEDPVALMGYLDFTLCAFLNLNLTGVGAVHGPPPNVFGLVQIMTG